MKYIRLFAVTALFVSTFSWADGSAPAYQRAPAQNTVLQPSSATEDKAAKTKDIRELFKLQKTEQMGQQLMAQIIQVIVQKIPANQKQQLTDIINKEVHFEEIAEMLVPIYDRNYTHAEIQQLLEFHKSPLGQKLINTQPKIMQDSTIAIQQWAMKVNAHLDAVLMNYERKPSSAGQHPASTSVQHGQGGASR